MRAVLAEDLVARSNNINLPAACIVTDAAPCSTTESPDAASPALGVGSVDIKSGRVHSGLTACLSLSPLYQDLREIVHEPCPRNAMARDVIHGSI